MIKIRLYSEYRDALGKKEIDISKEQMTLNEIIEYISNNYTEEFKKIAMQNEKISEHMLVMVGDKQVNSLDYIIKAGQTVKLLTTAHGG